MKRHCLPILCLLLLLSCNGKNKSTDTYSNKLSDKKERLNFLKQYLDNNAGLEDAHYHIWYQDNEGGMVPGPSDYYITAALKINPDSITRWVPDMAPCKLDTTLHYWDDLKLNAADWTVTSEPTYYVTGSTLKKVHRQEGIIFAVYSTNSIGIDNCN